MLPRPDTGTFNRFLTSLGLVLLAAAIVVPYLYFQSTDTLEIGLDELAGLTQTARDALESRQRTIVDLERWVIGFSVALFVGGIVCLVWGGRRLKQAQESEDEARELDKSHRRAQIRHMDPTEKREKRESDFESEVLVPSLSATRTDPRASSALQERRDAAIEIHKKVLLTLEGAGFSGYDFSSNVVVESGLPYGVALDGLFEAGIGRRDVVLEIKVASPESVRKNSRNYADQLIALVTRYQRITATPALGWLVLVIRGDEGSPEMELAVRQDLEDSLRRLLAHDGLVSVIEEDETGRLPDLFREFESSGVLER